MSLILSPSLNVLSRVLDAKAERDEVEILRSQNAILKIQGEGEIRTRQGRHRKYRPYAFTEQGIAMLSSVLNSERAILVNIAIIRTFVKLRQILVSHAELAERLENLEWRQDEQATEIQQVFQTIQQLIERPEVAEPKRQIGFPLARHKPIANRAGTSP